MYNRYGFSVNDFYHYVFDNDDKLIQFLKIIKKIMDLCINKKGKIAILVHNIEHVEVLQEFLSEIYPDKEIGLFYSKIKKELLKNELEKKIIISTDKSLGKAIDIPNLRFLISTIPTSSDIVLHQISGRLRKLPDREVMYFDLTDIGFHACKAQQKKRKAYMRHRAKTIKQLDL